MWFRQVRRPHRLNLSAYKQGEDLKRHQLQLQTMESVLFDMELEECMQLFRNKNEILEIHLFFDAL